MTSSQDYTERLLLKYYTEIQLEHFGRRRKLFIEGNLITFYLVNATKVITNLTQKYKPPIEAVILQSMSNPK